MSDNKKYTFNVAIAMMMLSIFGEELVVDHNEEQGLVTLHNENDDCYCTITKEQHDNLFAQLATIGEEMDKENQAFSTLMGDDQEELGDLSQLAPVEMFTENPNQEQM